MYLYDGLDRPADLDTIPPMATYPKPPSGGLSGSNDFEFIENGRGHLGYSPQWDEEHQPTGSINEWRANRQLEDKCGGA